MPVIVWNSSFSVGVAQMDAQHIRIIGLINALDGAPQATVRSEVVSDILNELTKYASEHFRCEEELLEKNGYPDLEEHRKEHRAYWQEVVRLCRDTMGHMDTVPTELMLFLRKWWVEHILNSDMGYRDFFRSRSVSRSL